MGFSKSKKNELPPWLAVALKELGVHEKNGAKHNKRILEYHKATMLKATTDEIPWCSAFANWCLNRSGFDGTNKANARSWIEFGRNVDAPVIGCIVVLWRGNPTGWKGHVGFFLGFDRNGDILILGGNQNNSVSVQSYSRRKLLCYRLPSYYL